VLEQPFPGAPDSVISKRHYLYRPLKGALPVSGGLDGSVSRRIIGWQLEENMREKFIKEVFNKACQSSSVGQGLIIHFGRGSRYAGKAYKR
jgi:transposase InsO family protein